MNNEIEQTNELQSFLQFKLGNEFYAVPLLKVQEVIPIPETTTIPNSPSHYVGIMNLRGQIISVVDLRKKLKVKASEQKNEEAVIIVNFTELSIGLVVDSINRVLNIEVGDVTEVPEVNKQLNTKYIQGVYRSEDNLTVLLDLENALDINEIRKMSQQAA